MNKEAAGEQSRPLTESVLGKISNLVASKLKMVAYKAVATRVKIKPFYYEILSIRRFLYDGRIGSFKR